MTLSPTPRVLSTLARHRVRTLLMGGQACILYGAAEFSRDIDIAVAVDSRNLLRLRAALADLRAEPVFFPPLSAGALRRGHACHFRCRAPELQDVRLDVMAAMRNAAPFGALWRRRVVLDLAGGVSVSLMSVEDLVRVKKTQRDKDWPMVRRLVETDIHAYRRPFSDKVRFWLRECRTAQMLCSLAKKHRTLARREAAARTLLIAALAGDVRAVESGLQSEEAAERELDRAYWRPLRAELERMRMKRPSRRRRAAGQS